MKIGLIGDLHLAGKGPERRKDNYFEVLCGKLHQAFQIFKSQSVDLVVQVGDFFNTPHVSKRVITEVIQFMTRSCPFDVYCVYGQHDVVGHSGSTIPNSPLGILDAAQIVHILREPIVLSNIGLQGASWAQPIPDPVEGVEFNILVTHRTVGHRALDPTKPLESPQAFLKANPGYQLVLIGDYHYPFVGEYEGRWIVNTGAMIRTTLTDVKWGLEPAVSVIDISDSAIQKFPLHTASVEEVFDLTEAPESRDTESLNHLIEVIRDKSGSQTVDWRTILNEVMCERNASTGVRDVIEAVIEKVSHE